MLRLLVGVLRCRRVPNEFVSSSQEVKYNIIAYLKLLYYFDMFSTILRLIDTSKNKKCLYSILYP